ncbi:hypothetical protein BCY88_35295 [Paraburkholderia fungorum]|uniref:HTH gntR-type domain-containing protein n=2 Tax=Paraburkholderia fungorum TaxID=134537 RepID=A0A3R7L847_9BURK|nr:hypothetical protein BCY88_35295 [Paraburkholderia fungorum]
MLPSSDFNVRYSIESMAPTTKQYAVQKLHVEPGARIADAVFATLRRAIVRHEIAAGVHLSVPSLALQLGTSRSPVHEAIKRLVQEGLAKEELRRGAFVTSFSPSTLIPLYEVRCALEALAAALAAERASDDTIRQLTTILDAEAQAIENDELERHIDIDMEFHRVVLMAAANPTLEEMLAQVYERISTAMIARVVPTGPQQALADHRELLQAIAARDSAAAGAAASAHVMRVSSQLSAKRATTFLGLDTSQSAKKDKKRVAQ